MKWLKRILDKHEIPATVTFDGLDAWLETATETLFHGLSTSAEPLYEQIKDIRERLEHRISELQDAEPAEDMPVQVEKIGLSGRDKMVKQLRSLTEKMQIPSQTDYKTVLSFYDATASSIAFVFGKSSKTIFHVRSLFPDEVKETVAELNQLRTALDQLISPIRGKESQIMHLERVPGIVEDIKELKSKIEKEKENVSAREKECSALEREIEKEGKRLSAIEDQEEWMINKELNLLKKQDETGRHTLTPDERKAVSSILSSPIRALDEDIYGFLTSVKDVIEDDMSILKERKRDKTLKWIDHLLNSELATIKEKREGLQSRIVHIKGELSEMTIQKERKKVEQSIASARGQLARLREGVERSKRHVLSQEEELEAKARSLPGTLEAIAGKPIEVNLDV
jgi:predicted  nucleic acid-binding Zn-ribbon protein